MPVTPKELCKALQTIDERLHQVRQHLIRCPALDAPQFLPALEEAARTLETLEQGGGNALQDRSAQQWLKTVRQRARRVKILLDSAAGFYEKVSRPPQTEIAYGPDGCLLVRENGGQISVQA